MSFEYDKLYVPGEFLFKIKFCNIRHWFEKAVLIALENVLKYHISNHVQGVVAIQMSLAWRLLKIDVPEDDIHDPAAIGISLIW